VNIAIDLSASTSANAFAPVLLSRQDGKPLCSLRVDCSELRKVGPVSSSTVLDLLFLAIVVYALDRRIPRTSASDNWTRYLAFTLPVSDAQVWSSVKLPLEKCLSFLTGDKWEIDFRPLGDGLATFGKNRGLALSSDSSAVCLFSGGLDSLVGAIDWLEENQQGSLILMGHHDPRIPGPLSDQKAVLRVLHEFYGKRVFPLLPAVGADQGKDTTLRSRSFLFIALGLYAANAVSSVTPLLVPENGTMALNVPLTPSRSGSCSTRTVHPHYLSLLRAILSELGIISPVSNPLELKTKGEALAECRNGSVLQSAALLTTSCAKRGHTRTWKQRNARQCGRCIPCIYRRAALHRIGMDNEVYGLDVCRGEVDIRSDLRHVDDFRAYLAFLRQNLSPKEVGRLLWSNGKLELSRLDKYAEVVVRAMDEVRDWLRDKAADEVKRQAGLLPEIP
jgi:hypothetical protein